ncbi:nucleotidyltransferase family protein [Aliisedimentitalea scapharcae]|uniref:Nucleotidyltransferase family protein n=1 Tax=Aliisedimentitalea scapharcae TaxID=1524259 RepID=A0ABZ2XM78_9RHOB
MQTIAILLLAAGRSSRMRGQDKLAEQIEGQPLLTQMCRRAKATGLTVFVTLPDPAHPRVSLICDATPIWVPDADEGMAASIRRGVAALPDTVDAVMILPSDMPELTTQDLLTIAEHHTDNSRTILRATAQNGTPGHPVLFPRAYFSALQSLSGDQGARPVLRMGPITPIALPAQHALTDLDTPEAWDAWRKQR